jgi:hypothetical protein
VRVLDDRMLTVTFGSHREKVTGNSRKLHHKNFAILNTIRVIKSRTMRWGEHVVRIGKKRDGCRVLAERRTEKNHLEDPEAYRRITLKWTFKKSL